MANLAKRKQIDAVFSSPIEVTVFSSLAASSANATTAITSALTTASRSGGSVPLQVSTGSEVQGVITTGENNRLEIRDSTTQEKIEDGDGNEVYGRLTEATGVYTISYFSNVAGAETAYTFGAATDIDFLFNYRFRFADLPADFAISASSKQIQQDPSVVGSKIAFEPLTVTATNTFSNLSFAPTAATDLKLLVNGVWYHSGPGEPVTLTVLTPGWDGSAFGTQDAFDVLTTDTVYAYYPRA